MPRPAPVTMHTRPSHSPTMSEPPGSPDRRTRSRRGRSCHLDGYPGPVGGGVRGRVPTAVCPAARYCAGVAAPPTAAPSEPPMPDDLEFDDRMSDADALMWTIEKDPLLRSTIITVMVFDRPIDRARLRLRLDRVSRVIPRLRQRVQGHPCRWRRRAGTSIPTSTSTTTCASPAGSARAPCARSSTSPSRSPCRASTGPGRCGSSCSSTDLADDRSALITKIHHSITDGVGGIKLLMELLDLDPVGRADRSAPRRARTPPAERGRPHRRRRRLRGPTPARRSGPPGRLGGRARRAPAGRSGRGRNRAARDGRFGGPHDQPRGGTAQPAHDRAIAQRPLRHAAGTDRADEAGGQAGGRQAQRLVRRRGRPAAWPATTTRWGSTATSCA